jgi:hypothetical protein
MESNPVAVANQGAIRVCLEEFRNGALSEAKLRDTLERLARGASQRQDLLYLQTQGSSLDAAVHGMALVQDGEIREGPPNREDWPYRSPLEAIRDGWRVIQFPNMALMMDESRTYGLGCEFILERWG